MAIRVPGIIVRIINDIGKVVPPLFERYPCIIGEGDSYRLISSYKLTRAAGDLDVLPTTTTVNSIISAGDLPGISRYVATRDYLLTSGHIDWSPSGAGHIEPTPGDSYYVTYTDTRPASAYSPMLYLDENLIFADHGTPTRIDGTINNVTVGAQLALSSGAGGVIVAQLDLSGAVDPDNPSNSELEAAFIATRDAIAKVTDYKLFLVPMSSGTLSTTSAANIFFNHAVLMSEPEQKQERTCVAALPKGTTYQQAATFAQSYAHERMVVPVVPDATVSVVGFTGDYDMRFYNCALAGKLCSTQIGRTISDEILPNITFTDNFSPDEANYLVQRGVSPGKIRGEVVRNILAITSDVTNALTEDLGVQDCKDYVKKYVRESLYKLYVNAPITDGMLGAVNTSLLSIMDQLIRDSVIAEQRDMYVQQNPTEPRALNVTGRIRPAFSLQWMDVTFTFVLSF